MKQTNVLDNACGLIALIHSIFNNPTHLKIKEESVLHKLNTTKSKTPLEIAQFLEGYEEFKEIHKKFALKVD
jgi:ubiquitin carboxyl-terminal hydrolase L3